MDPVTRGALTAGNPKREGNEHIKIVNSHKAFGEEILGGTEAVVFESGEIVSRENLGRNKFDVYKGVELCFASYVYVLMEKNTEDIVQNGKAWMKQKRNRFFKDPNDNTADLSRPRLNFTNEEWKEIGKLLDYIEDDIIALARAFPGKRFTDHMIVSLESPYDTSGGSHTDGANPGAETRIVRTYIGASTVLQEKGGPLRTFARGSIVGFRLGNYHDLQVLHNFPGVEKKDLRLKLIVDIGHPR